MMGLGVVGESFLLFYSVALGGHQIHVCCSNFIREVDFSIPAKVRVVCEECTVYCFCHVGQRSVLFSGVF